MRTRDLTPEEWKTFLKGLKLPQQELVKEIRMIPCRRQCHGDKEYLNKCCNCPCGLDLLDACLKADDAASSSSD